jgi:hypothetical protein
MKTLVKLLAVPVIALLTVVGLTTAASATISGLSVNSPAPLLGGRLVTVTGSLTCDPTTDVTASVSASVFQAHGRTVLQASGFGQVLTCTGSPQTWTVEAFTMGSPMKPGAASAEVFVDNANGTSSKNLLANIRLAQTTH